MSKNCELFIHVCNFMKYMLNEILPEQEATESVKTAVDDVLLAIVKYSSQRESQSFSAEKNVPIGQNNSTYSPIATNRKDGLESIDVKKHNNKKGKKLIITRSSSMNMGPENILAQDVGTLLKRPHPSLNTGTNQSAKLTDNRDAIPVTTIRSSLNDSNDIQTPKEALLKSLVHLNDNNLKQSQAKNVDTCCDSNPYQDHWQNLPIAPTVSSAHSTISSKSNGKNIIHNSHEQAVKVSSNISSSTGESLISHRIHDNYFEENFLQFYCFPDSEPLPKKVIVKKEEHTVAVAETNAKRLEDVNKISDKLKALKLFDVNSKYTLSYLKTLNPMNDLFPLGFQAINKCLQSKLIRDAFYCFQCDTSLDTYNDLELHLKLHKSKDKEECFSICKLCEVCKFSALVSNSKFNNKSLIDYHLQTHDSSIASRISPQNIGMLQDDFALFLEQMLRFKHMREQASGVPSFLGICLICKTSYISPLEWSHHIFEFQHFKLPDEKYITCTSCCLVLLGHDNETIFSQLMNSNEHLLNCPITQDLL